jgi:hypothetical protein
MRAWAMAESSQGSSGVSVAEQADISVTTNEPSACFLIVFVIAGFSSFAVLGVEPGDLIEREGKRRRK